MKDDHAYGKKMAGKGRTKVIYKGTFISIQTLLPLRAIQFPPLQCETPCILIKKKPHDFLGKHARPGNSANLEPELL